MDSSDARHETTDQKPYRAHPDDRTAYPLRARSDGKSGRFTVTHGQAASAMPAATGSGARRRADAGAEIPLASGLAAARRRPATGMPTIVAWLATAAKTRAVITQTTVTRASSRGGKNLLLGATRRRLLAHPGHAAPRPQRVRPSVRRMNSTRADRGWNERALLAASASMGDAPGAKLNR